MESDSARGAARAQAVETLGGMEPEAEGGDANDQGNEGRGGERHAGNRRRHAGSIRRLAVFGQHMRFPMRQDDIVVHELQGAVSKGAICKMSYCMPPYHKESCRPCITEGSRGNGNSTFRERVGGKAERSQGA